MNCKFFRKNFKNGPYVKFRPRMHFVWFSQLLYTWFFIPLPRVTIPLLVVKLRHEIWPVTHSMYMRSCSVHPLDVPGDRNRHPSTLSRRWFGPPLTPSTGVKIQHLENGFSWAKLAKRARSKTSFLTCEPPTTNTNLSRVPKARAKKIWRVYSC